tara:strand:+ start:677 stop:1231 length:555 start_codon:yes stop_codon:yes gene_type:complete
MGLKQDLIDAKVKAAKEMGVTDLDTSNGSFIERDAHYTMEAIANFITSANFSITKFNAPTVVEEIKTPDQSVNLAPTTLLGDKKPILDTLKSIGGTIPGAGKVVNELVDKLESALEKAVLPIVKNGATLPGLDLGKDAGGLQSTGYVYIGEDPDSQNSFNVEDEDGQRNFTEVKLFRDDIEDIL